MVGLIVVYVIIKIFLLVKKKIKTYFNNAIIVHLNMVPVSLFFNAVILIQYKLKCSMKSHHTPSPLVYIPYFGFTFVVAKSS